MQSFSSSTDISDQTNETQMSKKCRMHGRITIICKGFLLDSLEERQLRRLGAAEMIRLIRTYRKVASLFPNGVNEIFH
jgi:hypothetical protein